MAAVVEMSRRHQTQQSPAKGAIVIHLRVALALCIQGPHTAHPQKSGTVTETPDADAESLALNSGVAIAEKEDTVSVGTAAVGARTGTDFRKKGVP